MIRIILRTTGSSSKLAGLVTRKQFGVMLGAGIAMMLPQVANAVAVTESDVNVKTPDGTADCYFVHPASGTAPGVLVWPDIFGLRPAFRQMGKRLAESGYSVLVVNPFYRVKKAPTAEQGAATPIQQVMPLAQASERDDAHDGCEGVHRMAGPAIVGCQESQDGHPGLLHGRPDGVSYGGRGARSRRRSRIVPRRLTGDKGANSPHLEAAKSKAQFLIAIATNDDQRAPDDKNVMKETFAKANLPAEIEVYKARAWLVPAGYDGL